MKATEVKNMSAEELNAKLGSLKEELFALRFQLAANQLENTARIKAVKKDIARVKTALRLSAPVSYTHLTLPTKLEV